MIPLRLVDSRGRIEDHDTSCLHVNFASRLMGGGVIGKGNVQEEIRFSINPELCVCRLFTPALEDHEVMFMYGAERFSNYRGYGGQLEFAGDYVESSHERDSRARLHSYIVAMDSLFFTDSVSQFDKQHILRELRKSLAGFLPDLVLDEEDRFSDIATGNWGCGTSGGDKELKFVIQWLAASAADRKLCYYTVGDVKLANKIQALSGLAESKGMTIAFLLELVLEFQKSQDFLPAKPELLDYLQESLEASTLV